MAQVELSPVTYQRLLRRLRSFDDTADDVITRLLDATKDAGSTHGAHEEIVAVSPGPRLPIESYWLPILGILADAGGSALSSLVIDTLGDRLSDQLTEADKTRLRNGEVRWRNRARFARLRMKEQGLLSDSSHRGVWELTHAGRSYLDEHSRAG